MARPATIVWLRHDLRLSDNPALLAAVARGPVVPVFLWSTEGEGDWPPGGAQRVFLHHALTALDADLRDKGLRLIVRRTDDGLATLRELGRQTHASAVFWNRLYEPSAIERDTRIKAALKRDRIEVESFNGSLLFEPHELATKAGDPYKVFTPYYNAALQLPPPRGPHAAPRKDQMQSPSAWPKSDTIDDLDLLPDHPWAKKVASHWSIGEDGAQRRWRYFAEHHAGEYQTLRDRPDLDATSRMSPYLHLGLLSPNQVWATLTQARRDVPADARQSIDSYLRELIWREFSYHLLFYFPHTVDQPLRENFRGFPWVDMRQGRHWLEAWQRGRTGYPIVDAGMRQLWETGWMHNRVRMIVASFLTKDLRIHWLEGARWFWDTLVDADLANNTQGWQWSAGCGADAQPFFRIFNPTSQGTKFDPNGDYVRHWVPELADLPGNDVHEPWKAGVSLDYPEPIVDHKQAREQALAAFDRIKGR